MTGLAKVRKVEVEVHPYRDLDLAAFEAFGEPGPLVQGCCVGECDEGRW
jgi:hypothetical protein